MIPVRSYEDCYVAILGLGRSGLTAARALKAGGAKPVLWDDNEKAREAAIHEGFLIGDLRDPETWLQRRFAVLILSPGIPHLYPEPNPVVQLANEFNVLLDNDISLFFEAVSDGDLESGMLDHIEELDEDDVEDFVGQFLQAMESEPKVVCITGSNGKSTTTALIHHILIEAGRSAQMGGNIGRGVLDLNPATESAQEIYVLELSSYQTELARHLAPDIAVFLNFSPDHYDRHGGRGGYLAAKRRLFEQLPVNSIIGVDEMEGRFLAGQLREEGFISGSDLTAVIKISGEGTIEGNSSKIYASADNSIICQLNDRLPFSIDMSAMESLPGRHNMQNACAAIAVCVQLGLKQNEIEAGLKSYPGLPHRMEIIGKKGKVTFVNDSKATNVDSAQKALGSYDNIYWIAGGESKEGGIDDLKPLFSNLKKAYLIGKSGESFAATIGAECDAEICGTMEKAVQQAMLDIEQAGDEKAVLLLSPACASFDQYPDFMARGDDFRACVSSLEGIVLSRKGSA